MNAGDRYGALDRLLHRIAFRAGPAQRMMAEVEEAVFADRLRATPLKAPVFVTALPRSGTTILLRLLVGTGRFASHTYRDMPFVLAPMLWRRFSEPFAVDEPPRERAHGDGLRVSPDSPEAFEEMVWKHFWPGHYGTDRIRPWRPGDRNREFDAFLESHMRKVVALRAAGPSSRRAGTAPARYVSKNNLNLARLACRPGPLEEGTFAIPFREPVQQAASMLRQHRRFLKIHREDDFVREYMEAIGHHEFGEGLKPVDFGGWLSDAPSPDGLDFWVRYWAAAYRFVLEHADDDTVLVSYARLTEEPESALERLAGVLDAPSAALSSQSGRLRPPRTHEAAIGGVDDAVLEEARELYDRLRGRADV